MSSAANETGGATVPAGPRGRTGAFLRFLVTGGLSYVVDLGTLIGLNSGAGWSVGAATTGAYVVAFVFTFTLNRLWVFRASEGSPSGQVTRYLVLVGVNYLVTLGIVLGLTALAVPVVVAKTAAVVVIALSNFVVYRGWVFRTPGAPAPPL
jgi:putative flippase GtrA